MAEAKALLGRKNQHLGQLWYRSLTLRHVISLLDQVEDVAKVRAQIYLLLSCNTWRQCNVKWNSELAARKYLLWLLQIKPYEKS
jgi:hypothetical protein